MDRRVKERLVGASILVVLIVLIVPELLSGPAPSSAPATSRLPASAPEPVRNVTVDLATSKAPAQVQALDAPSGAAPVAAESNTGAAASAAPTPPVSAPAEPLEIAPPHPTSVPAAGKPANSGHAWAVQLGSFASHENADKLARQLKAQGFAVYVSPGGTGPSLRYRVRIGPMPDRGAATQTAAKLKTLGQVPSLVPPAP